VLERELSNRRISEEAAAAGRRLQRAYERLPAPPGSNWQGGDRIDPVQARNLKEDRMLDAVREITVLRGARFAVSRNRTGSHRPLHLLSLELMWAQVRRREDEPYPGGACDQIRLLALSVRKVYAHGPLE
jgi:hypothetical protein